MTKSAPSQVDTRPRHVRAAEEHGLPVDAFVPDTGITWEGRARTTAARIAAGIVLVADDVTAVRRHPDAVAHLAAADVDAAFRSAVADLHELGDLRQRTARALGDRAVARAGSNVNPDWRDAVRQIIRDLADERDTFTTDDVHELLADLDVGTHEPRALGALMRAAAIDGLIVTTPTHIESNRAVNHGRPVRVWKSLRRAQTS